MTYRAQEKVRENRRSPVPVNPEKEINGGEVARARWIITESEIKDFIYKKYPNCQKWRFFQMKNIINVTEWCVQVTVDGVCSTYEIMLIDGEYVFKHEYEAKKLAEEEARKKAEEEAKLNDPPKMVHRSAELAKIPFELKRPLFVFNGSLDGTIAVVVEITDDKEYKEEDPWSRFSVLSIYVKF